MDSTASIADLFLANASDVHFEIEKMPEIYILDLIVLS
jgi:hypothetical protein